VLVGGDRLEGDVSILQGGEQARKFVEGPALVGASGAEEVSEGG
jgi:hypothetical protein